MTNQRKNMLIALAVLVIIAGAIGFDQRNKSAIVEGQTSDIALADPEGALEMSSDEHDDFMLEDSDLSAEELALWEECEAQYDESSTEELELSADDPCAVFEDDFDDYGYHDDYEDGDFAEAGFFEGDFDDYDDDYGYGGDYGYDEDYGSHFGYSVLSLLLEAVVIGLVVAGVVIWFQRRQTQSAKK